MNLKFELPKTTNTTLPIHNSTNNQIIRLWRQSVEEFLQELGINQSNASQVQLIRRQVTLQQSTETAIEFDGQIIGTVKTEMKNTAAGLKFTITCQKVLPPSPAEPIEDDGVPHEIDYDRGDGTFVTASF